MSGEEVKQEFGLRLGYWFENGIGIHSQIFTQTEDLFALGQTYLATLFIRVRIFKSLEISLGSSIWKDTQESSLGNKDMFYKFMWGIAIPF